MGQTNTPTTATTTKLARPLAPLLPHLLLDKPTKVLLQGIEDAATALDRLEAAGKWAEAIRLVAQALPAREAVWWGCMCVRAVPDPESEPTDLAALDAAERWVRKPDDTHRRAAMDIAQQGGMRTPESWVASAVFWSGGSIAPPNAAPVSAPEHVSGISIAGAVQTVGYRRHPDRAAARFARFLAAARDIATGGAGRVPVETD